MTLILRMELRIVGFAPEIRIGKTGICLRLWL